ncbi:MAG TPA: adenylosuccinate lyase [Thermomicrobiales bacterium]|nr:adenylosuccinate lyase [Thermomicrobiales bacterium]
MIGRYTRPEMGAVWSDDHKLQVWLRVELAVCEAWYRRGRIPGWAIEAIRGASCDLERMQEIERETDHDVIAFLRATGETVGDASRYIHLGLTSSDVVDTALSLLVQDSCAILETDLERLIEIVGRQALRYRNTLTIGRTHGVHAEPTTFGLKLAVWYDELRRQLERLRFAREEMRVGKLSGAVGTHAHVPPDVEDEVCETLGLRPAAAATQIIQRDRHAFFLSVLAGIGATIEKFAVEVRHLQRTEVREVEEPFGEGNQGSSAMPHKRNPHESERLSGLARLLRGYAVTGLENVALWHERDISHSSTERVIFPDACIVLDYSLDLLTEIIENLSVDEDRMKQNLELTGGLIFSQRVMLGLVDAGIDRQLAYKRVQAHAMDSWLEGSNFEDAIRTDPEIAGRVSQEQITELFDPYQQLTHVDAVFERLGLLEPSVTR